MNKTVDKTAETRAGFGVEVRDIEGVGVRVAGYAAVFDEWADIAGLFQERIAAGAFDGRLGDDVVFLVNHQGLPLARTTSGTLRLSVDARGLWIETDLDPSDPDAARVISKLRRGDLSKMSFGFRVERETWDESGAVPRRTVERVAQLIDVSVVTRPAYEGTEIALRSLEASRAPDQDDDARTRRDRRMRMDLALAGLA